MAIVERSWDEAMTGRGKTDWARIDAMTPEEIEAMADVDELDEGYGIAVNYVFNADDTLTEIATGITSTRAEVLAQLAAVRAGKRAAAE